MSRQPLPPQRKTLTVLPVVEADAAILLPQRGEVQVRTYGQKRRGTASPLVLHFHGGAFVDGDLDDGAAVARLLAGAGAVVVSLAYPLAPASPFPHAVDTGADVLDWLYRHRAKFAGRDASLYLAGEEAGGNIAASVAMIARDRGHPPLAGQILVSPMLDPCVGTASLREATGDATGCKWAEGWQGYLRCPQDAMHPYAVPASTLRMAQLPRTLVLTCKDDPMRDEALAYARRLGEAGVDVTAHVVGSPQGWPDTLMQPRPGECPGAEVLRQRFRDFFSAPIPPPD
jgi:acetyl esterase/lipase